MCTVMVAAKLIPTSVYMPYLYFASTHIVFNACLLIFGSHLVIEVHLLAVNGT